MVIRVIQPLREEKSTVGISTKFSNTAKIFLANFPNLSSWKVGKFAKKPFDSIHLNSRLNLFCSSKIFVNLSKPFFSKYSCQPKGYISEGESTIDTQSNDNLPHYKWLQIRETLPQSTINWTQPRLSKHRKLRMSSLLRDFEVKNVRKTLSYMGIEPTTLRSTFLIQCKAAPQACALLAWSQHPGKVAV